jgi:hypothetical protein
MTDEPMHPTKAPDVLRKAPRCGARTRSGEPCRAPAVRGRKRCRMHGGAEGSGAPKGERNGNYKHGHFTQEAVELRRQIRALIAQMLASIE